jgi:hypothetical protein
MASKPPFATGAQVEHPKYGPGSVTTCTDQHISIKFDEHGERKFLLEIAQPSIKKIDRQPPAEKRASRARKKAVKPVAVEQETPETAAAAGS